MASSRWYSYQDLETSMAATGLVLAAGKKQEGMQVEMGITTH
jgi:hypothetical protein